MSDEHNKSSSVGSSYDFVDIPPNQYDVLLPDINEARLEQIGFQEGIEHLSPGSFSSPAFSINGVLYGLFSRFMVPLVCQRAKKSDAPIVNIWFLVDTGSPHTYLSDKSLKTVFGAENDHIDQFKVAIQEKDSVIECHRSPPKSHFVEVNILGTNALRMLEISIGNTNWKKLEFQLVK